MTVLELSGELDLATAGAAREVLVQLPLDTGSTVRVDLTNVGFPGSTGIGLTVTAWKRIRMSGGKFSVTCGQRTTRRVLQIGGLVEYLSSMMRNRRTCPSTAS